MNGIHDLGGMDGFGPIPARASEPIFGARWEARVFALTSLALAMGVANADAFRHAIERLPPRVYLSVGYYGRWLRALEALLERGRLLAPGEVAARLQGSSQPARPVARRPARPAALGARRAREHAPRFAAGDRVRAANHHPSGHTRLPRYVRGRRGAVARVHPDAWVLPDANAHGLGERPEPVYAVRFDARELWGPEAEPGACVHVDLFESYLEPDAEAGGAGRVAGG